MFYRFIANQRAQGYCSQARITLCHVGAFSGGVIFTHYYERVYISSNGGVVHATGWIYSSVLKVYRVAMWMYRVLYCCVLLLLCNGNHNKYTVCVLLYSIVLHLRISQQH